MGRRSGSRRSTADRDESKAADGQPSQRRVLRRSSGSRKQREAVSHPLGSLAQPVAVEALRRGLSNSEEIHEALGTGQGSTPLSAEKRRIIAQNPYMYTSFIQQGLTVEEAAVACMERVNMEPQLAQATMEERAKRLRRTSYRRKLNELGGDMVQVQTSQQQQVPAQQLETTDEPVNVKQRIRDFEQRSGRRRSREVGSDPVHRVSKRALNVHSCHDGATE